MGKLRPCAGKDLPKRIQPGPLCSIPALSLAELPSTASTRRNSRDRHSRWAQTRFCQASRCQVGRCCSEMVCFTGRGVFPRVACSLTVMITVTSWHHQFSSLPMGFTHSCIHSFIHSYDKPLLSPAVGRHCLLNPSHSPVPASSGKELPAAFKGSLTGGRDLKGNT